MTHVRSVIFSNLCRVCTSSDDQKIDVFSMESKSKNLCGKTNECLSLNMEETDRLPKMLCHQCVQNVEKFMEFRNLCRNSQIKLTGWLNMATDKTSAKKTVSDNHSSTSPESVTSSNPTTATTTTSNIINFQQCSSFGNSNLPIAVTAVPPLTSLAGNDLMNSMVQTVTIQQAENLQQQQQNEESEKEKNLKNNSLQEFLKLKPNLKITSVNKKLPAQQPPQQLPQQQPQQQQQQQMASFQQQQQQPQDPFQLQQLQQQLQLQLQQLQQQQFQQQLQQQLQMLTSQFQPQQITITAPNTTLAPLCANTTLLNGGANTFNSNISDISQAIGPNNINTSVCSENDEQNSLNKNKKSKLNFVLTPPNNCQGVNGGGGPIQLQLQAASNQSQQQAQNAGTPGALISNLVPLLQQQATQGSNINAVFQNQSLLQPTNNANAMLSSNKCYLPITIKDENTDQQFVAHIDAKNFLLPTTYQLQMKLQPQIATADGQPIMQLAPTSIPATLQITPQGLSAAQGLNPATLTALGGNLLPAQLSSSSQLISLQPSLQQGCPQQQIINIQPTSMPQEQLQSEQHQSQILNKNMVTSEFTDLKKTIKSDPVMESSNLNIGPEVNGFHTLNGNKLRITSQQHTINSSIDNETPNNFTQQILQQIQQQQTQFKQQPFDNISMIQTQHGGITVQRVKVPNATSSGQQQSTNLNTKPQIQVSTSAGNLQSTNITKLPLINNQNVTISRITPPSSGSTLTLTRRTQVSESPTTTATMATIKTGPLDGGGITKEPQQTTIINELINKNIRVTVNSNTLPNTVISHDVSQPSKMTITNKNSCPPSSVTSVLQSSPPKKTYKRSKKATNSDEIAENTSMLSNQGLTLTDRTRNEEMESPTKNSTIQITCKSSPISNVEKSNEKNASKTTIANSYSLTSMENESAPITTSKSKADESSGKSEVSSFQCPTCNRLFKKKEFLVQHVKLHAGVRPFKCNEDGCHKAFSRKEHLHRHLISHTGKKLYSCDFCQKLFSRKDNLSKHRKTHTEINAKTYNCDICSKTFAVKSYYEQHKLKHQQLTPQTNDQENKEMMLEVVQQVSTTTNPSIGNDNNPEKSRVRIVQQQEQPQIMHLQLPSSIVSTTANNLVGNTITITESAYPTNTNNHVSFKSLQQTTNNNIHDATVLNLPTSMANFVQQAQIVNSTTGQIMGHVKIQK